MPHYAFTAKCLSTNDLIWRKITTVLYKFSAAKKGLIAAPLPDQGPAFTR